jgi:hypothetical protein
MRYGASAHGSVYIPKLLGIYERELEDRIEEAIALDLERVVVVGAAEGFYAVGMAMRCPRARVLAFEMDPDAQRALASTAGLNGVDGRLEVSGRCDRTSLLAAIQGGSGALVVCDAEGAEAMLLDPLRLPPLQRCWILVEVHEFILRGIGEELRQRFAASHHIDEVWQQERHAVDFPYRTLLTRLLPTSYLQWAVSERRPERMSWLWMKPLAH